MNQESAPESMEKPIIQCFKSATYHTSIFSMTCAGACDYNHMPSPSRPDNQTLNL